MTATVDIKGAAEMLKIHPKSVLDLIGSGALPAARVGRAYVMMTKDVLEYIEGQIISQTAERLCAPGRRLKGREPAYHKASAKSLPRKLLFPI